MTFLLAEDTWANQGEKGEMIAHDDQTSQDGLYLLLLLLMMMVVMVSSMLYIGFMLVMQVTENIKITLLICCMMKCDSQRL
jgi:hypothetical protein